MSELEIIGTEGADELTADPAGSTLLGLGGNDSLIGAIGDDSLVGGAGNDTIRGIGGDNTLHGGAGDDFIYGGDGNDTIRGGAGNDYLTGNDIATVDFGETLYEFDLGWGQDTVNNFSSGLSIIEFGSGILSTDFIVQRENNDVLLMHSSGDSVLVRRILSRYPIEIDGIRFADGTI